MATTNWQWITEQKLPSDIAAGRDFINELLRELERQNWGGRDLFGIHLALEEAVVNAIRHGNKFDPQKQVSISCRISPQRFEIEIADEGKGFNPCDVPDCTDDEHLDVPSGRGVLLMRCYMTRVQYNKKGNVVTLEKDAGTGPTLE
jgi:serine/threonine-protein kinase RsbW